MREEEGRQGVREICRHNNARDADLKHSMASERRRLSALIRRRPGRVTSRRVNCVVVLELQSVELKTVSSLF